MCQKESWGAIFATKEAHSTQRCQPPRMHGPGLWRYKQKEQRVTPVLMSGVNCDLWCRGGTAKILEVGQSKTQDTPPDHGTNTEHDPLLEGQPVEYIKHVGRYVSSSRNASYLIHHKSLYSISSFVHPSCVCVRRGVFSNK